MPIEEIIKFLRQSMLVQDPDVVAVDEDFLSMTDEDFIPTLQICLSRVDPKDDLFSLSQENLYPLILITKKELYHRLALKSASSYTIKSSTGAELTKSDIFEHYYKLIEEVEQEYKNYLATGVPVQVGEILLSSRYFSQRNFNLAKAPKVRVTLDTIYEDKIEFSWKLTQINKFARYEVYISTSPIVDKYKHGNPISSNAKKVCELKNIHTTCLRIEDLPQDTTHYLVVLVEERNGLKGFEEIKFTTLQGGE